jgi:NADPH:quinone reductase-like Zn-dependent oxidoreductase
MKYHSVISTKRGGPEVLQVIEQELHAPDRDQVRIKVLAAPVSLPDVEARYGRSPFKIKTPFVPGYAIIGEVDEAGAAITSVKVGDLVAVMTVYGGYTEYYYSKENQLIPVPANIDPIEAAPLILNYIVAFQALHRLARVTEGDKILIIGASGGIGTAFLQLGSLSGLKTYGLASKSKHSVLTEHGAIPIDYHTQDYMQVIRNAEPEGLDAVFDGIGGDYINQSFSLLRKGGVYVGYCNPQSLMGMFRYLGKVMINHLSPNGCSAKFYGTGQSRLDRKPFLEDWEKLFELLSEGRIKPLISRIYPILEAAEANRYLESGKVCGNIVLAADGINPGAG